MLYRAMYRKAGAMKQLKFTGMLLIVVAGGCTGSRPMPDLRPDVDLSPVGCGYKWFQSGYGPTLEIPCDQDRSAMRDEQKALAREHAWETARARCPDTCAPVELKDSIETEERFVNGVCRNDFAHYSTRVFFQCGP